MANKIKTKKKKKDPNALKQPMNAYFFFLKDKRTEFQEKHPDLKPKEVVKELHKKWIELDIIEKEKYQELSNADKVRYLEAKNKK